MFYKVKSVKNLENYILEIVFENNIIKYYDVSKLFEKWTVFKKLKTSDFPKFFSIFFAKITCKIQHGLV